jgi:hypothetical protein
VLVDEGSAEGSSGRIGETALSVGHVDPLLVPLRGLVISRV